MCITAWIVIGIFVFCVASAVFFAYKEFRGNYPDRGLSLTENIGLSLFSKTLLRRLMRKQLAQVVILFNSSLSEGAA